MSYFVEILKQKVENSQGFTSLRGQVSSSTAKNDTTGGGMIIFHHSSINSNTTAFPLIALGRSLSETLNEL